MVQICVVSCSFCHTFQGQQVKKEKKWTCKMCGEKQSFRKIFAQGSGKECRLHVQKLNMMKGKACEEKDAKSFQLEDEPAAQTDGHVSDSCSAVREKVDSKWKQFIEMKQDFQEECGEQDEEDFYTTEREIFKKHIKGQKRKKADQQVTSQERQGWPKKIQRNNAATNFVEPSYTNLENITANARSCSVDFNPSRPSDQADSHDLRFSPLNYQEKSCDNNIKKTSKWSKFT